MVTGKGAGLVADITLDFSVSRTHASAHLHMLCVGLLVACLLFELRVRNATALSVTLTAGKSGNSQHSQESRAAGVKQAVRTLT